MRRAALVFFVVAAAGVQGETAELATIQLRHRLPQEMAELVRPLLDPGETVIAAPSGLIVKASLPRLQEINTLVQELDQKQHRLMITVAQGRGLTREALDARAEVGIGVGSRGGAVSGRGHVYGTESLDSREQTQQVQTLDGQAANIRFGEQIAVPQGGVAYGYPGAPVTINQGIEYRDVTTGFSVLPRLTGGEVVLEISPWSDRISRGGVGSISTQAADTTLRASLGEWIEIGGQVESLNRQAGGLIAHSYSTRSDASRIYIKVDDLDR